MCNANCIIFGANNLKSEEIKDKRVLEIGAYNVNGSLRSIIEKSNPQEYVGIDIIDGNGVDIVCSIEDAIEKFGKESFDLVISNELLEHVKDWRLAISNIKNLIRPGGVALITTRSFGFPYHGYPNDFWRYEVKDMKNIFSDLEIIKIISDSQDPGVFVKAKKPFAFQEKDLVSYELYSIVAGRRTKMISSNDYLNWRYAIILFREKLKMLIKKVIK